MVKAVIPYNQDAHFDLISPWFKHYWGAYFPKEMIPTDGYIVYGEESGPLVAGFLYHTNSSIVWLEDIIGNPEADKAERKEGIAVLLQALEMRAKALGFKHVFTATAHANMIEYYKQAGFQADPIPHTLLIKGI